VLTVTFLAIFSRFWQFPGFFEAKITGMPENQDRYPVFDIVNL